MKFEIKTLKDKLNDTKVKVSNAINSPRGLKVIALSAALMPFVYLGIKFAYSLLTGDHSQVHDTHQYIGYAGDVAHNPHLAKYDTNHDGVLSNVEMYDTYNQETVHVVHGLNLDNFHVQSNDLETIAKFDTNGDGQWNLAEFKAYIAQAHPELANVPDAHWDVYKNVDLGGKYVPFDAD
jgi:hypothetical protein